jgi:hypothetical protein
MAPLTPDAALAALRHDPTGVGLKLRRRLPAGQVVDDARCLPLMWLSDTAPGPDDVAWARAAYPVTGLWPLLLGAHAADERTSAGQSCADAPPDRHASTSALYPYLFGGIDSDRWRVPEVGDAEQILSGYWPGQLAEFGDTEPPAPEARVLDGAPAAPRPWPGLAPAQAPPADPGCFANGMTEYLLAEGWLSRPRLALVPCSSSSEALISLRLVLAGNAPATDDVVAVLRSWEQRFGARLIGLKPDALYLSVAAAPQDRAQATRVAYEHFALDADIVFQGSGSFRDYADELIDVNMWSLWWD